MNRLRQAAKEYLAIRRSIGFKLRGYDYLLGEFLDELEASGGTTLTIAAALSWATAKTDVSPVRWGQRLSVVRGFARYLQCLDPDTEVPPIDLLAVRRDRRQPYLYSDSDIVRMLEAAARLRPALRGATYATYLGLVAATGMRMGEAIGLDRADVDLGSGVVEITETKFRKHRRLPLHGSTVAALRHYVEVRDALCPKPSSPAFFVSTRGTRLLDVCVHRAFNQLLRTVELSPQRGAGHPRIHDLRHRFATVSLADWHREGVDPAGRLPVLAAYLGHADPAFTYWYVSASPELLTLAAKRLERFEAER